MGHRSECSNLFYTRAAVGGTGQDSAGCRLQPRLPPALDPSRPSPPPATLAPLTRLLRLQPERGGNHEQQGQEAARGGSGHHGPTGRQLGRLGLRSPREAPPLPGPGRLLRGRARRWDWAQLQPGAESH